MTWLLTAEDGAHHKLPLIKTLRSPISNTLCIFEDKVSFPVKNKQQFFEVGSVNKALELLSTPNVDPKTRKSGCVQLSVMLEEANLHAGFLEQGGLKIILDILRNAIDEKQFADYPDSVIPVVKILKNLCLYNSAIRMELSSMVEIYLLITRCKYVID